MSNDKDTGMDIKRAFVAAGFRVEVYSGMPWYLVRVLGERQDYVYDVRGRDTMSTFRIHSRASGLHLGTYEADSREAALDALARDAGYSDHAAACKACGDKGETLIVTEIVDDPAF
jgi:hypothetical protein